MNNKRREFLRNVSLLTAGISLHPFISIAKEYPKNSNQPPLVTFEVAIALLQTGMSAGKMFQGNSSSGVLDTQVQMLKVISGQLEVINKGVLTIIQNIEEVKKLIVALPQVLVEEINKNAMQGNIIRYDNLIDSYINLNRDRKKLKKSKWTRNSDSKK